jgi:hypothetical protein
LVIDSSSSKPIKFKKNTCTYDWGPSAMLRTMAVMALWYHSVNTASWVAVLAWIPFYWREKSIQVKFPSFILGLFPCLRYVVINVYLYECVHTVWKSRKW